MNETNKPIDIPSDAPQQTQALTVRDAVQAVERAGTSEPTKPAVTAAQAKIEAVANLTAKAYERASELTLTPDEIKALQADFPDEAFKPGAAGKENLIYIEHAFLRDRLNAVIGPGQWALIPRSRWAEDFTFTNKYGKVVEASRVYCEAMLLIRGCFVAESVGEMEYWKNNAGQNYGDAVEGAKTAALRRCCKEFGIGLQAWKKDWCAGWWQRRNGGSDPAHQKPQPQQQTRTQSAPQQPPPSQQTHSAPARKVSTNDNDFPCVNVLTVKEVHSKPDAAKKWTAYFIRFSDGLTEFEAATFDTKIADVANELANTNETAVLHTKPGRKEGTKEIVRLSRAEQPPSQPEDNIPMAFDEQGNPIPMDVMP